MEKINLNIGSKIFVNNQEYQIKKYVDLKNILALNLATNKLENIYINYIKNEQETPSLIIHEDIPESYWEEAKKRLEIISPLVGKSIIAKEEIEKIRLN